ncbi:hypothetical protein B0T17DRAFT_506614 [Bombardia bombarda]|uniref:Uncharacterized protein n=1 Tax=Bombardia bombarda TaxID=252184 RepID=A0AA39XA26_9PEZI|nr:hypothetical protein B0T17DRAFT_506614 [Bombardia bombarda]
MVYSAKATRLVKALHRHRAAGLHCVPVNSRNRDTTGVDKDPEQAKTPAHKQHSDITLGGPQELTALIDPQELHSYPRLGLPLQTNEQQQRQQHQYQYQQNYHPAVVSQELPVSIVSQELQSYSQQTQAPPSNQQSYYPHQLQQQQQPVQLPDNQTS